MKVFTEEFIQAVEDKLNKLEPLAYLTREQICLALNVSLVYMPAISILMADERFNVFEAVKSRGIRRKKISVNPNDCAI
jgi:hypothetical protein